MRNILLKGGGKTGKSATKGYSIVPEVGKCFTAKDLMNSICLSYQKEDGEIISLEYKVPSQGEILVIEHLVF